MDFIKKNWVGLIALVLIGIVAVMGSGGGGAGGVTNLNSLTLDDTLATVNLTASGSTILDELTQGGLVLSTSTDATATVLRESDLLTFSQWNVTVELTDLTYTFPASSTLTNIVPSAGDTRTWTIVNATSTAGIDVIFAGGTGTKIKAVGAGGLTLDEDSHGTITLSREPNTDITILVAFPDAD